MGISSRNNHTDDYESRDFDSRDYPSVMEESYTYANGSEQQGTVYESLNDIPETLSRCNMAATVLQFLSAAAIFLTTTESDTKRNLYLNFPLSFDEREGNDLFGIPGPDEFASYSVSWYSAVFMTLSAASHLIVSCACFRPTYEFFIARNQNPFRWFELALSASVMRTMIAQLSGVTDLHLLLNIFCLTSISMLLGSVHESVNWYAKSRGEPQNWYPFRVAWLPHLASWTVILCYFSTSVSKGDPPIYIWVIICAIFVLDGMFALLFWIQWSESLPFQHCSYVHGEIGFIILSIASKNCLAWINFFGSR